MPVVRQLSYKDRSVWQIEETVDTTVSYPTAIEFPDQTTEIIAQWLVSQEQYTRILSALMTGAELAYPYEPQQIFYDFMKMENAMTCEDVADCIETDAGVQTALQQYFSENYFNNQAFTENAPDWYTANELLLDGSQISSCNNDNLFGGITQMIDFINIRITDFMEQAELITNAVERIQLAIAGIPIVGALPADELVGFIDQVFEEIAEIYAANFTADLRDEYRCDLFCLVKDTCELDFQAMADYFLARVGASIDSGEAFVDAILWFTTGVFVGTAAVDACFGLVCQALAYTSSVFGINIAGLALSLTAAMNDPDNDWEILCENCPDPTGSPEIGVAGDCVGGLTPGGTSLTFVSGNTWQATSTLAAGSNTIAIRRSGGLNFHLSNVLLISGPAPNFFGWGLVGGGGCNLGFSPPSFESSDWYTFLWTSAPDGGVFVIQFDFTDL